MNADMNELNKRISRLEAMLDECLRTGQDHESVLQDNHKKIEHNFRNINDVRSRFEAETYRNRDVFTRID